MEPQHKITLPETWHTVSVEDTLRRLDVRLEEGLTSAQVLERREQFGSNVLREQGLKSPLLIVWEQLTNPLVLLLLGAAVIAFLLGKGIDAVAVLSIVVLNAILGFVQEYRAEKAMAALKRLSSPVVRVRREGALRELPAEELVPGDVLFLEAGNSVPADARLVESANLRIQEAALTGESVPENKFTQAIHEESLPLGDRRNLAYMGTAVTYGRGVAVVTGTGMNTELGRIADLIQSVKTEATPLQKRMGQLGRGLALTVLAIVGVAFIVGLLRGEPAAEMFQIAVSMAVAAVPEGLPAVVTIVLALGAQRMLRRRALIRKLPAVETLGSVTVICSDKTGTLTENRMTVTVLDVVEHTLRLEEVTSRGLPVLIAEDQPLKARWPAHQLLLTGGALCNDAVLQRLPEEKDAFRAIGDPTEGALVVAAARVGLWKEHLELLFPRVAEVPFTSERRRMSTVHRAPKPSQLKPGEDVLENLLDGHEAILFTKGGVDSLLEVATSVWVDRHLLPLDDAWRARVHAANDRLAQEGLRVLGVAFRPFDPKEMPSGSEHAPEAIERDLVLVGLVGMMDPPRAEVMEAVRVSQEAGIRPVMITGDHPLTAMQIADMLNIANRQSARVLTGVELSRMNAAELEAVVEEVSVYARVSPEHKLNIVQALQNRGHVVAMTGDGVNDAPALRKSNIGVAMGITGTDVSKEAASMVIMDDNFATIVSAVEEGRRVYENVRKFIRYTLGSNAGEILVMFFAPLLGMPLPLTPLQILWMNLVTDGFPGLALTSEQPESDIMKRPPVRPDESIFSGGLTGYILRIGLVLGISALAFAGWAYTSGNPAWKTMVFTMLILGQAGHALAIRSSRTSIFAMPVSTNPSVYAAVLLTVLLQLAAIYWGPLQNLFGTVPLTGSDLLITLAASSLVFIWVEVEKWVLRRTSGKMKP
jgi:Ca2+-transporting ATPase